MGTMKGYSLEISSARKEEISSINCISLPLIMIDGLSSVSESIVKRTTTSWLIDIMIVITYFPILQTVCSFKKFDAI